MFNHRQSFKNVRDSSCNVALVLALLACASSAIAQTPGTFTPTGNMTSPRLAHTAILLPNGKVLINGGVSGSLPGETAFPSGAELYDPSTGAFTATGGANATFSGARTTLLPDGRVLITGGGYTTAATPTVLPNGDVVYPRIPNAGAQLYDPSTGTFTSTGNMTTFRSGHTATLLPNGKVLIAGGLWFAVENHPEDGEVLLNSAELYDPSTGTFTPTGNMLTAQLAQTATLLSNGKVLLAGGYYFPPATTADSELYDPATGTFTATGNMILHDYISRTATLLTNGKVLFTGGENDDSAIGTVKAELYNPSTGTFTPTGNLTTARQNHTATLLSDGTVLIAGGSRNGGSALSSVELYDPASGTFSAAGDMTTPRWGQTATLLATGTVLISGGNAADTAGSPILPTAELFCPASVNCPSDPRQKAIIAMKTAAGTDSLNFYQWAWYWQTLPPFSGAPAGFGVPGSISPVMMQQIIAAGGGNPLANVSAEQWVSYLPSSTTVVSGVLNAASHLSGPIAPGEFVVIKGSGLGPAQIVAAAPDSNGVYPSQLAGTTVQVNGGSVPLIYTSASEVGAVLPDALAGATAEIKVTYQGQTSAPLLVALAAAAPGIFTVDSTGQGHAASITQNGSLNTAAHWEGDVVTLFATGLGQAPAGVTIHGFALPVNPISIDKTSFPGVMQIKEQILHGQDCDTPVTVQVGNASSQAGVTIAIDICI